MRILTVKRRKSFVAGLSTVKVYIEDPSSKEIVINNIPCRKLGLLKNGEEKNFSIGEEAAKVFVIGDSLSKDFCNDFYQLAEGSEDIYLEGQNKYNPAAGNRYVFDNNDTPEAVANRKKGVKKGWIILAVAAIIGFIVGYGITSGSNTGTEKTFSDSGMNIVLTSNFRKFNNSGYTVAYDSQKVAVFGLEEKFSLAAGLENYSVEAYAKALISNNSNVPNGTVTKTYGDLLYFEYDNKNANTGVEYHYYTFIYKEYDAFWFIQFATEKKDAETYKDDIFKWAESVNFNK